MLRAARWSGGKAWGQEVVQSKLATRGPVLEKPRLRLKGAAFKYPSRRKPWRVASNRVSLQLKPAKTRSAAIGTAVYQRGARVTSEVRGQCVWSVPSVRLSHIFFAGLS